MSMTSRLAAGPGFCGTFENGCRRGFSLSSKISLRKKIECRGIAALCNEMPNTVRVPRDADLTALLRECNAVAGVNSSVLYEARLMHRKPAYAYGRSWFTNHEDLFVPLSAGVCTSLPRQEWIERPSWFTQSDLRLCGLVSGSTSCAAARQPYRRS